MTIGIGPQIFLMFRFPDSHLKVAPYIESFLPFGLLLLCLSVLVTEISSKAVSFTPGETEFLFPGPFKRRELLLFKLFNSVVSILFMALIISIFIMRFSYHWMACFTGIFLCLIFIHLFSITAAFLRLTVLKHAYTQFRKYFLTTAVLVLAVVLWRTIDWALFWTPLLLAQAIRDSWIGCIVLAPFDTFGNAIMAKTIFPDLFFWASAAAGIIIIFFLIVILLDANYLETSLSVSEKTYAKMKQMRHSGGVIIGSGRKTAKHSLPVLPWMGGIGPILWRQITTAFRSAKGIMFLLLGLSVGFVPILIIKGISDEATPFLLLIVAMNSIFFTQWFPFDFRSDLDRMDWLKMMPIGSIQITVGQILTPVIFVTLLEFILFGGLLFGVEKNRYFLFSGMMLAPSFNLLLFGLENLFFLLFPSRLELSQHGDFQGFGRIMIVFFMKFIILFAIFGAILGIGFATFVFSGKLWSIFFVVIWILLTLCGLAILPYIAWAFEKFDPSIDTPA